jgi:hypothetical protein
MEPYSGIYWKHTLNCISLYDAATLARILFVIQKLVNMNPGSNDIISHDIVLFQDFKERALDGK